jgi:hypothetical protein
MASFDSLFPSTLGAGNAGLAFLCAGVMALELLQRERPSVVETDRFPRSLRLVACGAVVALIFFCGAFERTPFIYFRF